MRGMRRAVVVVVVVSIASTFAVPVVSAAPAETVVVSFELKLLWRGRLAGRTRPIDLWSGAALEMRRRPRDDGGARLSLRRPLEHPWVFRWYDDRDEVKLGGEVWLPQADGDVFAAPAAALLPLVDGRWRRWWDDPFWAEVHRDELERRDPPADPPVYPFWVLGDLHDALSVVVDRDGRVDAPSIVQRVDRPWIPDGWSRALDGAAIRGTGHWDPTAGERPRWAPNGYAALAAALALLDDREDPARVAADVVTTLLPRLDGRLGWRTPTSARTGDATTEIEGRESPRLRIRRAADETRVRIDGRDPRRLAVEIVIGISR